MGDWVAGASGRGSAMVLLGDSNIFAKLRNPACTPIYRGRHDMSYAKNSIQK